jgi:hypothetical protein
MKIRKYFGVMPLVGVVAMSGLFLAACGDEENGTSAEGGEVPVGEGEGEPPMDGGEGEGEGQPMDGGEGEGEGEVPAIDKATLFCATYLTRCTGVQGIGHTLPDWVDDGDCAAWYDAAAVGDAGADAGASQACYEYPLNAADGDGDRAADAPTASQNTHCGHAGGMAPCTDG